jgi:hypothetical protein
MYRPTSELSTALSAMNYQPTPPRSLSSSPTVDDSHHHPNNAKENLCQDAAELDVILHRIHSMAIDCTYIHDR